MTAILSNDGKIVIPEELRKSARLQPGDTLDVHIYKGTLVLRKHEPLSLRQCADLLEQSRSLPESSAEDEEVVRQVIREVRSERR